MSQSPWTPVVRFDCDGRGVSMKTIHTGCGSFLTGAEIADAVSALGLALARVRDLDVVDIPFVAVDGAVYRAQFRIGWLINTVVTDDKPASEELVDVDTIFELLDKRRALAAARSPFESRARTAAVDGTNWDEII